MRSPVRAAALAMLAMIAALSACNDQQQPAEPNTDATELTVDNQPDFSYDGGISRRFYGVTVANRLVSFDASRPCRLGSRQRITGLQPHEQVLGIDFRPATGGLYALGSTSRLYLIDPATAVATEVGVGPFSTLLDGTAFGFDFNPTVDRIRVVSNSGQNLRLNPITGAIAAVDTALAFANTDPNVGAQPRVVGAAYTNPDNDPATGTLLYDIEVHLDLLVTQNPPNGGVLNTVGKLFRRTNRVVGFDIGSDGIAYAALKNVDHRGWKCGPSSLYTIDLVTGKASFVSGIGTFTPLRGLAIPLEL